MHKIMLFSIENLAFVLMLLQEFSLKNKQIQVVKYP